MKISKRLANKKATNTSTKDATYRELRDYMYLNDKFMRGEPTSLNERWQIVDMDKREKNIKAATARRDTIEAAKKANATKATAKKRDLIPIENKSNYDARRRLTSRPAEEKSVRSREAALNPTIKRKGTTAPSTVTKKSTSTAKKSTKTATAKKTSAKKTSTKKK